jgi:hypothetical protein
MTEPDLLRRRFANLIKKTESGAKLPPASWWVGDKAGERRVHDDIAAGRVFWKSAYDTAVQGIKVLDKGLLEEAGVLAWMATDFYISALENRVRPEELNMLSRPSQRRGRRKKNTLSPKK